MIISFIILGLIFFCFMLTRAGLIVEMRTDWNYYVHRYDYYSRIHSDGSYSQEEINKNRVTIGEAVLVFFMIWKTNPYYFFDFKPDWEDIHELYILKK